MRFRDAVGLATVFVLSAQMSNSPGPRHRHGGWQVFLPATAAPGTKVGDLTGHPKGEPDHMNVAVAKAGTGAGTMDVVWYAGGVEMARATVDCDSITQASITPTGTSYEKDVEHYVTTENDGCTARPDLTVHCHTKDH